MTRLWEIFDRAGPEVFLFVLGVAVVAAVLAAIGLRYAAPLAQVVLVVVVIASVTLVLYTTMRPAAASGVRLRPHLNPLPTFSAVLDGGPGSIVFQQALGNLLLMLPFACALTLLAGWRAALVSSLVFSVSVEIAQWVLATGRLAETSDVVLNVTGAAVGIGIAVAALKVVGVPAPRLAVTVRAP
ncbi:MAG TPA: VanZ family protein [Candidatus Nanopelagicales bacterium]|jgi:glycopeptide antibiotics resistance protein|nr:VanZ family protein [Candidatus Nanopelagicales bacterium]